MDATFTLKFRAQNLQDHNGGLSNPKTLRIILGYHKIVSRVRLMLSDNWFGSPKILGMVNAQLFFGYILAPFSFLIQL